MNRTMFENMGSGTRIFFMAFIFFSGMILSGLLAVGIMAATGQNDINLISINLLKLMQTFQEICIFLAPALITVYLFENHPTKYLRINALLPWQQVLLTVGIMVCIQPVINWLGYYNSQIALPEYLADFETVLKEAETTASKLTERFLSDKSIWGFTSAIMVVAAVAAVCEEFFFRGVLQQLLAKLTTNIHIAIWISAIIFSAIHFQFYGFIPRVILGAILGYIFAWSGNLWLAVFAHFLNNAFAVTFNYLYSGTTTYEEFEKLGTGDSYPYSIGGIILTSLLITVFYMTCKKSKSSTAI